MAVHDRLAREYATGGDSELRNSLESLHHELLGSSFHLLDSDRRLKFVEQLDEIGRTLSYWHHEHRRAVNVFRLAVQLDPEHAYGHHYLAYNLDWLAEDAEESNLTTARRFGCNRHTPGSGRAGSATWRLAAGTGRQGLSGTRRSVR